MNEILMNGLVRDLNPGPLAPEARIIPLDQRASVCFAIFISDVCLYLIVVAIMLPNCITNILCYLVIITTPKINPMFL